MVVPAVCHTKTSTRPGRESWQPRGFLAEIFPDKVLIYLIYLATLSTLPSSLRWQARPAVGNLDRDGRRFVARWDEQPDAFGWTARELFGLHPVPERPAGNYSRLSRLDDTGLIWLLRGRPVVALTETTAAIQGATAVLTYRKINKPALGPVGDSLDDWRAT
jgi:hypothetical protein